MLSGNCERRKMRLLKEPFYSTYVSGNAYSVKKKEGEISTNTLLSSEN
jgi:hypothetical protein